MNKLAISLILIVLAGFSYGQNKKIDSLKKVLTSLKEDTSKVNTYNLLCKANLPLGKFDKAKEYADKALQLSEAIKFNKGIAQAYNYIAYIYLQKEDYPNALFYYQKVLALKDASLSASRLCFLYIHIGNTEIFLGNYPNALKNYLAALDIAKKMKDYPNIKQLLIKINGNIGVTYYYSKNATQSIVYYTKMLEILKTLDSTEQNQQILSRVYTNIGVSYMEVNKPKKGLKNYQEAIKIAKHLNDTANLIIIYTNMAATQTTDGQYASALDLSQKAILLSKASKNINGLAEAYNSLGAVKLQLGKAREAKELLLKSLEISKKTQSKYNIEGNYKLLAVADSTLKNYKSAYHNYKMYIIYRDSLQNKENTKKITQLQMQFKFDQEKAADSIANAKEKEIQNAKIAQQDAEIQAKQNLQYALFGGLALVIVFAGFMYNRFKKTQKQKAVIEQQKILVEVKNQEISDSITYAKRIQEAILPSRFTLSENLTNGFVFFKPKDIVSGDFYWLEKVDNAVYFAAADCTGHGVPGAMVSVICANALSKALLEENITETGKLLDRTRELVVEKFAGSGEDVKDGMDISLCKLEGNKLQWSGANNPLWIIRNSDMFTSATLSEQNKSTPLAERSRSKQNNNNQEVAERSRRHLEKGVTELVEVKPDKQPIGKTDNPLPFTTHNVELNEGDAFYIFTDGYADQFGGEKGKKFKYKPMKDLLLSIQDKTLEEQKTTLNNSFEDWKGDLEQVDDVCVIGVRL